MFDVYASELFIFAKSNLSGQSYLPANVDVSQSESLASFKPLKFFSLAFLFNQNEFSIFREKFPDRDVDEMYSLISYS